MSPPRHTPRRSRRLKRPPPLSPAPDPPCTRSSCSTSTRVGHGWSSSATGLRACGRLRPTGSSGCACAPFGGSPRSSSSPIFVQVALGVALVSGEGMVAPQFHMFYGFVAIIAVGDHVLVPRPAAQPPVPALRVRRPVPDGPRHPRPARRPHLSYRFTTGQVRVRVMPSIIWMRLTTRRPRSSTVAGLGLRDHVVGPRHVVGRDDAVDRSDLEATLAALPTSVWMRMYTLTAMCVSVGRQPARRFSSSTSSARSSSAGDRRTARSAPR